MRLIVIRLDEVRMRWSHENKGRKISEKHRRWRYEGELRELPMVSMKAAPI